MHSQRCTEEDELGTGRKAEIHLTKEQNSREYTNKLSMESETQNQQSNLLQERIDELVEKFSLQIQNS